MNIGILSGTLLLLEGVNKTFVVWVELSSVILRDHFVRFLLYWHDIKSPKRLHLLHLTPKMAS